MKAAGLFLICGMLYAVNTGAQTQEGAQAGVAASGQASAQASQHGTQASAKGNSSANASAQGTQGSAMLADGTAFNATLDKPIDSKKSKVGEPVTAHTTEAVKSGRKTILPKGTKMMGHVTEASARANGQADSQLGIVFDKAVMKDGQEMPMNASIQALGTASSDASAIDDLEPAGGPGYGGSAAASSGRGGVTSTAGGAVGGATNTVAGKGNAAGGTLNSATQTTASAASGATHGATGSLNAAGQFTSNSRGVFGIDGLNLNAAGTNGTQGSLITSAGKNVHLDSGTRMLLDSQANAPAAH